MEALENQAAKVDKFATGQVARVVRSVVKIPTSALGSPLQEVHQQWALTNADLITSMHTRYLNGVAKMVEKAVREGQTTRDLTKALQTRYQMARRHAPDSQGPSQQTQRTHHRGPSDVPGGGVLPMVDLQR